MRRFLGALLVVSLLQASVLGGDTKPADTPAAPAAGEAAPAPPAPPAPDAPAKCGDHTDCRGCILDTNCGWCSITGECTEGTVTGPNNANCSVWDYAFCTGEPCSSYKTCHDCLKDSFCGWCDTLAADKPGDSKCTEGNWQGSIFGSCAKDSWHKASCPPNKDVTDAKTTLGHGDPNVKNGPMPEAEPAAAAAGESKPAEGEAAKPAASGAAAVAAAVKSSAADAIAAAGKYKPVKAATSTVSAPADSASDMKPAATMKSAPSDMHVASSTSVAGMPGKKAEMDEDASAVPPSAPVASMDDAPVSGEMPKAVSSPPTQVQLDEEIANAVPIPRDAAGVMIEMQEERKQVNAEQAVLDSDDQQFS